MIEYMDEESRRLLDVPPPSPPVAGDVVAVANAWIREADPGATANAGYMTLVNIGSEAVTLVSVESAAFEKIEMHEMVTINDLPRMHEVKPPRVPPGGQDRFAPGGKHMMMIGPRQRLTDGQQVHMTLIFDSGKAQIVSARVAKQAP